MSEHWSQCVVTRGSKSYMTTLTLSQTNCRPWWSTFRRRRPCCADVRSGCCGVYIVAASGRRCVALVTQKVMPVTAVGPACRVYAAWRWGSADIGGRAAGATAVSSGRAMALVRVLASVLAAVVLGQRAALAEGTYSVPEPHIQALRPKGVRFSIPDEPGVELFAVHANINKEMRDLEAGQLSADVLRPRDGRWVFEDHKTALRPGDRINYWLYVKRDGLGFRRDGGTFTVTELVDKNAPAPPPLGSSQHCPQGCPHEGVSGGAVDPLTEQRLRHAEELHQQRMRHAEELHRERLHQLQIQQQRAGHGSDGVDPGAGVQDVSAFKRIGSRR